MPVNDSVKIFERSMKQRIGNLQEKLDILLATIPTRNKEHISSISTEFYQTAKDIDRNLTSIDQPRWLRPLINNLEAIIPHLSQESKLSEINKLLSAHYHIIKNYKFNISLQNEGLNFDNLFETYNSEGRLDELFEELIECLKHILENEEIDSSKLKEALQKMISTLESNKKGSYYSRYLSYSFVKNVLKNWVLEELIKLPALGGLIKALSKTIKETDEKFNVDESHLIEKYNENKITKCLTRKINIEVNMFRDKIPSEMLFETLIIEETKFDSIKHIEYKGDINKLQSAK